MSPAADDARLPLWVGESSNVHEEPRSASETHQRRKPSRALIVAASALLLLGGSGALSGSGAAAAWRKPNPPASPARARQPRPPPPPGLPQPSPSPPPELPSSYFGYTSRPLDWNYLEAVVDGVAWLVTAAYAAYAGSDLSHALVNQLWDTPLDLWRLHALTGIQPAALQLLLLLVLLLGVVLPLALGLRWVFRRVRRVIRRRRAAEARVAREHPTGNNKPAGGRSCWRSLGPFVFAYNTRPGEFGKSSRACSLARRG